MSIYHFSNPSVLKTYKRSDRVHNLSRKMYVCKYQLQPTSRAIKPTLDSLSVLFLGWDTFLKIVLCTRSLTHQRFDGKFYMKVSKI